MAINRYYNIITEESKRLRVAYDYACLRLKILCKPEDYEDLLKYITDKCRQCEKQNMFNRTALCHINCVASHISFLHGC